MTNMKAKLTFGGVVGAALVAVVAASAWACVALASISLDPGKGAPGETVKGKGTGFGKSDPALGRNYSNVIVRWGGADGPVVADAGQPKTVSGSGQGSLDFSFKVPADVAPGTYAVTATQTDATGAPVWGTPARATFTVSGGIAGQAPGAASAALSPENIVVTQQRITQANAARAPQAQQQATAAPAPARPSEVPSLEVQDAIDAKVSPSGSRTARFSPASSSSDSNSLPLQAGLGLVVVGALALLTAGGAFMVLRSAQTASSRR